MSKFHPHGDSSIYDAMVRMGIFIRYMLVDGHGSWLRGWGQGSGHALHKRMTPFALNAQRHRQGHRGHPTDEERSPWSCQPYPNLLVNSDNGIAVA